MPSDVPAQGKDGHGFFFGNPIDHYDTHGDKGQGNQGMGGNGIPQQPGGQCHPGHRHDEQEGMQGHRTIAF